VHIAILNEAPQEVTKSVVQNCAESISQVYCDQIDELNSKDTVLQVYFDISCLSQLARGVLTDDRALRRIADKVSWNHCGFPLIWQISDWCRWFGRIRFFLSLFYRKLYSSHAYAVWSFHTIPRYSTSERKSHNPKLILTASTPTKAALVDYDVDSGHEIFPSNHTN